MVNPWHKTRRSVEKDYKFYDPPRVIYNKITQKVWCYSEDNLDRDLLELRDLSYMCLLYGTTCRASELCRFDKYNQTGRLLFSKPSVDTMQFHIEEGYLKFREVIVLKRKEPVLDGNGNQVYDEQGKPQYKIIEDLSKYPTRNEINFPLEGSFSIFTNHVLDYIEQLPKGAELYPFRYRRGWQIVNHVTGEMQHYLRSMGLKFYTRLLDRNLEDLKEFSGHARIQNLMTYLGEGSLEKKISEVKF